MDWRSLKHSQIIELQFKGNLNPSLDGDHVIWLRAGGQLGEVIAVIFNQVNC